MASAAPRQHLPALDGVRGLAILLVMAFHFGWAAPAVGLPAKALVFLTNFGWTGVDLFFVLSGFLITGVLVDSKGRPGYFRNFFARRVLRIAPLYYGVLAVTLAILPRFVRYDSPGLRLLRQEQGWLWAYSANVSVALRHGEWIWNPDWLRLGMLWSLAVEEHFYLVWPLVVRGLSRRALLRLSVAMVVTGPLLRGGALAVGVPSGTVFCLSVFRADALAAGGALAVAVRDPELLAAARRSVALAAAGACIVIAGLTARRRFYSHLDPAVQALGYCANSVLYGALVLAAWAAPEGAWGRRLLASRPLRFCGKHSYGAYILHELLRPAFVRFFPVDGIARLLGSEAPAFAAHGLLGAAASFGLAVATFRLYERPFLGLKRFFEAPDAAAATPAVEAATIPLGD